MDKSLRLGTYFGIPVYLHWTFSFLIMYVVYSQWKNGMDIENISWFLVYIISIFLCVTLHEYGHALMARRFKIETKDIILSPIGGVARLTAIPKKWHQEFLIALAGPAVNIVIVVLGMTAYFAVNGDINIIPSQQEFQFFENNIKQHLLFLILTSNLFLALFNLIPAFPMDGGRVFRAVLSIRFSYIKATLIAVRIGQLIAIGFITLMLYQLEPINLLVGVFLLFVSSAELQATKYGEWLDNTNISAIGDIVIKIESENDIHFDSRRGENHYWIVEEKEDIKLSFYQTFENQVLFRPHEEVSGQLPIKTTMKLISAQSTILLVYKNPINNDYKVVSYQHMNNLSQIYASHKNRRNKLKAFFKRKSRKI